MLFNSLEFLVFFPIVVLGYYIIPKYLKQLWLLIASYYFYMCWNAKYALLIFFSTVVTYLSGLLMERIQDCVYEDMYRIKYKKLIVAMSFILNLMVLFCFKYCNFALYTLGQIFHMVHIELNVPAFDIVLPVGISFYTFQALSYTMDVYRDEIYAEKNFLRYALFVSFFPQLVAGPIERSKNLLKQLAKPKKFDFELARDGIFLMLWGFFLKMVLADRIALFVDTVYSDYSNFGGGYLIVATILFAFQIYCDFYGYSVIAMGAAETLGIQLMENFKAPYFSTSVADFWRRWHISLTSWFRDYLYIPLGGSRKGQIHKYLNKLIVFLISGLWHGASSTFVIWGGLNGLYQIMGEILYPIRDKLVLLLQLNRKSISHKLLQIVRTFILVDFSWIFFRANGIGEAYRIIKSMCTVNNPWILFDGSLYNCGLDSKNFWLMILCIGVLIAADCCRYKGVAIRKIIVKQEYWFRWLFFLTAMCTILIFGVWGTNDDVVRFLYFQF